MSRTLLSALIALAIAAPCAAATNAKTTLTPEQARGREIYSKLISYKTSEGNGQVPVMAAWLAQQFRDAGIPDADIHLLPVGETASLVVRYRGDGTGGKPILLMAHMDVVAADPKDWTRDPFTLIEENGYFFGRGTSDVKDGVATLSSTFLRLKKEKFVPTRDLVIVFTGDEETQMATTQDLVNNHKDLLDADYALNYDGGGGTLEETGQPRTYSIQTAEKTYADYELTVHNPGGHSSWPRPDNAIYQLADALKKVQAYKFPTMWNDTTLAEFTAEGKVAPGELGAAMRDFAKNPRDEAAVERLTRDTSQIGRTRTTCVATMLRGGHAKNALPQSAVANINCRIFPGVAIEDVRKTLQEQVGPGVEVTTTDHPTASDASPLRPDVMEAVTRAIHKIHPGVQVVPNQASGASDGLYFRAAGIPTYGVGGMFIKDSDSFAHGLNERVPVKGFYDGLDYWYALMKDLGGKH
ncbi:M20/M25/M40 family metallo-hydrolase [Lysobacter sp. KIS68-7]|uniref:M20/M25/M40 family metallo-hydrolase n=1 Tax=Lysobacter sp. KIS68-7 TaxID=2904252 RepID=UPI001E44ED34|nr:M20/M25/M40 family metallo-hydrolase [Lysobacter sp. KIS68-7]UHQ20125.1 M20/M25/M40 family metallo-hydrolase [Lysobacter sp. KIS68-7]